MECGTITDIQKIIISFLLVLYVGCFHQLVVHLHQPCLKKKKERFINL